MVAFLIVVIVVIAAGSAAVGLGIFAYRVRDAYQSDQRDWTMTGLAGLAAAIAVVVALGTVGVYTGELNLSDGPNDGCWRISSSEGSGVGVGVNPKGGVTVVPVITSGKTYTPIACP